MPTYRLIAGQKTVVDVFDADDDEAAVARARQVSREFASLQGRDIRRAGFCLEKEDGREWRLAFWWIPRVPPSGDR